MVAYTNVLKYNQPQVGGPADINVWGGEVNTNSQLIENVAVGIPGIPIGGLTTYTMTLNNGATDDYKAAIWNFTGALSGNCTVTIPASKRPFVVQNSTTGGFNVILTTGSGTTFSVPPNGNNYVGSCYDGTNVVWEMWAATATNESAQAGTIGEYVSSTVASSTVNLSTGVSANITTISLGAGDWDVWGNIIYIPSLILTGLSAGINTVSATPPTGTGSGGFQNLNLTFITGLQQVLSAGMMRQSLSTTTTIYLVGAAGFSSGTCTAGGTLAARRAR